VKCGTEGSDFDSAADGYVDISSAVRKKESLECIAPSVKRGFLLGVHSAGGKRKLRGPKEEA